MAQIPYHLNRAMDNGLTQAQAAEVITHLAFIPAGRTCSRRWRWWKKKFSRNAGNDVEFYMEIKRVGSQPSNPGAADWFYGYGAGRSVISDSRSVAQWRARV